MRRWIGLILGGLWLIVAIALLIVSLAAVHGDALDRTENAVGTSGASDRGSIDAFVQFAKESQVSDRDTLPPVGVRHDYTAEGLRLLAAALTALGSDPTVATTMRAAADQITDNPFSLGHASVVHESFSVAARELGRMVPADAVQLRELANSIRPGRPLIEQTTQVRRFFETAGDAVHSDEAHQ